MAILEQFDNYVKANQKIYQSNDPFPHVVIDDFVDKETCREIAEEYDKVKENLTYYRHYNSKKYACNDITKMGPKTRALINRLQSPEFISLVSALSGVKDLIPDPTLEGGGMHMIGTGGFLNVHTDFLSHAKFRTWSRQINLLLYLNEDWKTDFHGELELWSKDGKKKLKSIEPVLGRCVIFSTVENSYHGHPVALSVPDEKYRKSIALYYFRDEGKPLNVRYTDYIARPEDGIYGKMANQVDKGLLWTVAYLKRRTGFSDKVLTDFMKKFTR